MLLIFAIVALGLFLSYHRAPLWAWFATFTAGLLGVTLFGPIAPIAISIAWAGLVVAAALFAFPPLRASLFSAHIRRAFRAVLPPMSQTERDALQAGTIWWDADLFSGAPKWKKLLDFPAAQLTAEEQAFIDGPAEALCRMLDDWKFSSELNDLTPEVWQFIRDNHFFGMIIPKQYGGLGFSALAHSQVVMKISSRSVAAAVTVMVPNSLGPAELLLHYGTPQQKDHYLPRLASGLEIPCFGLTAPEAGSDASSIPDRGIVCRAEYQGRKDVLGIRITWEKRYITLGPVATVLGLAFRLYDPDHLLSDNSDRGITLALIPTDHPGVNIGRRHYPLGIAFQNGPNSGKDVFIPMDWVIGGLPQVGFGWRMLMDCLAAGRSISLPALSVGAAKFSTATMGAYSRIRKQFKTPIGHFEGIEEPLARMAGYTYMMDAARTLTAGALDKGESPSVISAILKYNLTERMRKIVNDAMDVQGGAGICLGPHNVLGKLYQAIPISITVEGANILTRSLIVYGQGAIRCHPYILKEMESAVDTDEERGLRNFDRAFWGHVGFTASNVVRSIILGITGARFVSAPTSEVTRRQVQQVTRLSSVFALVSDAAMLTLGGSLKRREKISGRLADVLSQLYLASATIKRFEDQGRKSEDADLARWALADTLYTAQEALIGILDNLPNQPVARALRVIAFPFGRVHKPPSDQLGHFVARSILEPSERRNRLVHGVYLPTALEDPVGRLNTALTMADEAEKLEKRLAIARKEGGLTSIDFLPLVAEALDIRLIDPNQADFLRRFHAIRQEIIKVDDFASDAFRHERKEELNGPQKRRVNG